MSCKCISYSIEKIKLWCQNGNTETRYHYYFSFIPHFWLTLFDFSLWPTTWEFASTSIVLDIEHTRRTRTLPWGDWSPPFFLKVKNYLPIKCNFHNLPSIRWIKWAFLQHKSEFSKDKWGWNNNVIF